MLSIHDLGVEPIEAKPVALITPEKAAEMLKTFNQGNRKISDGLVKQYARAMKNDSWSHITELSFDTSNRLIDGQHRLSAVIKSNNSPHAMYKTFIFFGGSILDFVRHRTLCYHGCCFPQFGTRNSRLCRNYEDERR